MQELRIQRWETRPCPGGSAVLVGKWDALTNTSSCWGCDQSRPSKPTLSIMSELSREQGLRPSSKMGQESTEAKGEGRRRLQKPLGWRRHPQEPPPYAALGQTFMTIPGEWKGLKQSRPQTLLHLCPNSAVSMSINNIQMGPIASMKLINLLDGGHSLHLPPLPVGRLSLLGLPRAPRQNLLIFIYLPPGLAENRNCTLPSWHPSNFPPTSPSPRLSIPMVSAVTNPDDFIWSREMTFHRSLPFCWPQLPHL